MITSVILQLLRVNTIIKRQDSSLRLWTFIISRFCYKTFYTKPAVMASQCFKGQIDHYNGVTIDSKEEPCDPEAFKHRFEQSLQQWTKDKRHTIWFRVHLSHSEWIPVLVNKGFKFHHAREEHVMLYHWLPIKAECNVPPYAHTNLGVGAFVFNEKTNEVLVVKENQSARKPLWKLPGGYVEPGENIEDAVIREVLEETGIKTIFKCLVTFRHGHNYLFGCSDIYIIAYLSPINLQIKKCDREILESQWMKLEEYSEHPEVHENNRQFAKNMQEFLQHRMGVSVEYGKHPITKKPISVYSIAKISSEKS